MSGEGVYSEGGFGGRWMGDGSAGVGVGWVVVVAAMLVSRAGGSWGGGGSDGSAMVGGLDGIVCRVYR